MKKLLSFLIIIVSVINIFTLTTFAQSKNDLSVIWTKRGGNLQCIASFNKDDLVYEMVINGLKNKLDDSILKNVLDNLSDGKATTITDPGIIDAEKFSCFNPMTEGIMPYDIFVDMSGIREEYNWGDSMQCWASSVSNMLTTTGWAEKAINPDTGKKFSNEDEVFSFFTRYCANKGCYAFDGIQFFFNGTISKEMEMSNLVRYPFSGAFPDKDVTKYLKSVKVCDDDESFNEDLYLEIIKLINKIKDGGSIGLSTVNNECIYTLKDKKDVELQKFGDKFREPEYIYVDRTTPLGEKFDISNLSSCSLEKHFYAIDEEDNVVILEKSGDSYKELSGRVVDTALVKEDVLLKKDDGNYIYPFMIDEDVYTFVDYKYYSRNEVDIEKRPISFETTGGHALTANGYVKNVSTGNIEGLFVLNSDNDSDMMPYKEENLSKENRPNRMVVYPTSTVKGNNNMALALLDYNDSIATIVKVALLLPETDYILGDADMNKMVDIMDATCIQKYLVNLLDESKIDKEAADVDSKGLDIMDATFIQKFLVCVTNIDGTIPYDENYEKNL